MKKNTIVSISIFTVFVMIGFYMMFCTHNKPSEDCRNHAIQEYMYAKESSTDSAKLSHLTNATRYSYLADSLKKIDK